MQFSKINFTENFRYVCIGMKCMMQPILKVMAHSESNDQRDTIKFCQPDPDVMLPNALIVLLVAVLAKRLERQCHELAAGDHMIMHVS